ncbi:MAG: serine acetyltransferase [Bacilli bacterium]|nr:serine acetyltransferase [Bacilli bacterium]
MKKNKNKGVTKIYKLSNKMYRMHFHIIPKILKTFIRVIYGATIPYKSTIGDGTVFPHGALGVVIHEDAIIGNNCKILPNAVIGGRGDEKSVPVIGNNVLIGAGAVIIGNVKIGDNSSVGANAVVLKDVPNNSIAVGVPAKVTKK